MSRGTGAVPEAAHRTHLALLAVAVLGGGVLPVPLAAQDPRPAALDAADDEGIGWSGTIRLPNAGALEERLRGNPAGPGRRPPPPPPRTDTLRWVVTAAGRPVGSHVVWTDDQGARHAVFEYEARGLGPHLEEVVRLGEHGVPVELTITGNDENKAPVTERLRPDGDGLVWESDVDPGSSPRADAFYLAVHGTPETMASLARALLATPERRLALLPAGEATVEGITARTVSGGAGSVRASLFAIAGPSFVPIHLWLDDEGELFMLRWAWLAVVREGWSEAVAELASVEDSAAMERRASLARSLAHRPAGPLAIRNARLFDPASREARDGTTVLIEGDRIGAVGRDGEVPLPAAAEVIDAGGRTLLPGLFDMHVHLFDDSGPLHLAAGVTTVRDLMNDSAELRVRMERFGSGELLGPRVIRAGAVDGPGPYASETGVSISTRAEALLAVDDYAAQGYEQVKIQGSVAPDLVSVIAERAHARGLRVGGHVPAGMLAEQSVRAGYDEIHHANMLVLNFLGDTLDTRTADRLTAVAGHAAELSPDDALVAAFLDLLERHGTVIDPTLNVFEGAFVDRKGRISVVYAPIADRLPAQVRRLLLAGGLPVPSGKDDRYRDSFEAMLRLVGAAHERGITIVAGTDALLPGFAMHRELELYVTAGIPNADVLALATLGAARVMKRDAQVGSIEPGKLADMVLVDGDPLRDMSAIRRTTLVMKAGTRYDPAELLRAMSIRP